MRFAPRSSGQITFAFKTYFIGLAHQNLFITPPFQIRQKFGSRHGRRRQTEQWQGIKRMNTLFFTLFRHLLHRLLRLRVLYLKVRRLGPHGEPARILTPSALDGLSSENTRFKKLLTHWQAQATESSCSVASVACIINAMAGENAPRVANQMDLLETIRAGRWKERLSPEGWQGRRGLPLEVLGEVIPAALSYHGIEAAVKLSPFYPREAMAIRLGRARTILNYFASNPGTFLIAHFDQGAFLPVLTIPHISPVAHWDPERETVVMLDVDPDQPIPYEISLSRFVHGISSHYGGLLKPYGYSHGGIVTIHRGTHL